VLLLTEQIKKFQRKPFVQELQKFGLLLRLHGILKTFNQHCHRKLLHFQICEIQIDPPCGDQSQGLQVVTKSPARLSARHPLFAAISRLPSSRLWWDHFQWCVFDGPCLESVMKGGIKKLHGRKKLG
jgi:hypothetical protein